MNRLQPVRFYAGLFAFLLAALVVASFYFLFGMAANSYIVSDGAQPAAATAHAYLILRLSARCLHS